MFLDVCRDQVLLFDAVKKGLGTSSLPLLTPMPAHLSFGGCAGSKLPKERHAQGLILARGKMWPRSAGMSVEEEGHPASI